MTQDLGSYGHPHPADSAECCSTTSGNVMLRLNGSVCVQRSMDMAEARRLLDRLQDAIRINEQYGPDKSATVARPVYDQSRRHMADPIGVRLPDDSPDDEVTWKHIKLPRLHSVQGKSIEQSVFDPHWPEALEARKHYEFPCDDKGREGDTWLRVMVADDGDVHVSMQEWKDIREKDSRPNPFPSVRCRTLVGGGRNTRTRQALLWLAEAIRLDNAEAGRSDTP